jgi:hypothetical protein
MYNNLNYNINVKSLLDCFGNTTVNFNFFYNFSCENKNFPLGDYFYSMNIGSTNTFFWDTIYYIISLYYIPFNTIKLNYNSNPNYNYILLINPINFLPINLHLIIFQEISNFFYHLILFFYLLLPTNLKLLIFNSFNPSLNQHFNRFIFFKFPLKNSYFLFAPIICQIPLLIPHYILPSFSNSYYFINFLPISHYKTYSTFVQSLNLILISSLSQSQYFLIYFIILCLTLFIIKVIIQKFHPLLKLLPFNKN